MKKVFIPTKYTGKLDLSRIKVEKLSEKIGLVTTVQFADQLSELKKYLEDAGKKCIIARGYQANAGQVLGCEQSAALQAKDAEGYLYLGDGFFHPIGIALATGKPVFIYNPFTLEFRQITHADISKIENKKRAMLIKFYSSNTVGVIVSSKPGQDHFAQSLKLENAFKDKEFFYILFDNIDYGQLENFNFIDCWINTACPRIQEDIKVLNLKDIPELK